MEATKPLFFDEFKKKIIAGENIEELAKEYRVQFYIMYELYPPDNIPVEKLIEIIEKAPELVLTGKYIPVWVFLLLLIREKFDLLDKVVSDIFCEKVYILEGYSEKEDSDIVRKTLSTIKQVTKEQISVLLSLMEKKKNLLSKQSKDEIANFIINNFLVSIWGYIDEECFLLIFDWISKETNPYFFKNIYFDFLKKLPMKNPSIQGRLVDYFISAHPAWLFNPKFDSSEIFSKKENLEKINIEFFVSSVVKSYSRLHDSKKIYLLNFPYFIENYPQLAVKSLKAFTNKPLYSSLYFIIEDNKIFIPDNIWDTISKENPSLFLDLIKLLPGKYFYFDVNHVKELISFINPANLQELNDRLKILKGMFRETPVYKIIEEINKEALDIRKTKSSELSINVLKFAFDRLPYNVVCWFAHNLLLLDDNLDLYGKEELEHQLSPVKPQLLETLSYLDEVSQTIESIKISN